jgi:hypothetical protein
VDKPLVEHNRLQLFNVPGKGIMLNAYKNKTDIILSFVSENEIPYDARDEAQTEAARTALASFVPRTAESIRERNTRTDSSLLGRPQPLSSARY